MAPMIQRRVNMSYVKDYSKQVGLIMNIKNDLRSLQFHIVGVALDLAWEGKILGLESKDKLQPVSQWSWWYIILCCEKHIPRYRNLDKADTVKKLKGQGHAQPIKFIRVVWRMVDCRRAVNTFLAKLESGLWVGSKDQSRHLFKDPNLLSKTWFYGRGIQEDWESISQWF